MCENFLIKKEKKNLKTFKQAEKKKKYLHSRMPLAMWGNVREENKAKNCQIVLWNFIQ